MAKNKLSEQFDEALTLLKGGYFLQAHDEFKKLDEYSESQKYANEALILYNIIKEDGESNKFFKDNIDNFELINDNNKLKNIFINSWYEKNTVSFVGNSNNIGNYVVLNSDGTGTKKYNNNEFMIVFWKIENGYLYYEGKFGNEYTENDKYEVRKILDDVYLIVDVNIINKNNNHWKYGIGSIFISEDSSYYEVLKKYYDSQV